MNHNEDLVTALIIKAQRLSGDFNEMLQKTSCMLEDSKGVDQKLKDCCSIQDDQVLSNLIKICNDGDRVQLLLENAELKRIVDENKVAIKLIMEKYKIHTEESRDKVNLRERYVAKLEEVAVSLDRRLEEMTAIMMYSLGLDEHDSNKNQRIIEQLTKENAEMRRKLQIYTNPNELDYFEQALPTRSDSSTQSEPCDTVDPDSISMSSTSSFVTCFSYTPDAQSSDASIEEEDKEGGGDGGDGGAASSVSRGKLNLMGSHYD